MNKKKLDKIAKKITERRTTMFIADMDVNLLKHHPKNPRKDLGDLEELTDSIRQNGIMQNLTVMPVNGSGNSTSIENAVEYYVLIGNRRFEAGKKAGLRKFPCCIIEDVPEREQISIMLEENMQRSDLTPVEQAEGFQMMLDLGETIESIVDKTGFNKTTVYHRLNLAKLNKESLKKKQDSFQLTLTDLYALEQIKDINKRNKILEDSISSNDIKIKADQAAREERKKENMRLAVDWLNKKGIMKGGEEYQRSRWSTAKDPESTTGKWLILHEQNVIESFTPPEGDFPTDAFFEITDWNAMLTIFKENPNYGKVVEKPLTPKQEEEKRKREERDKKRKHLESIEQEFKELFRCFVKNLYDGDIKIPMELRNIYFMDFIWEKMMECQAEVYPENAASAYYKIFKYSEEPYFRLSDFEKKKLLKEAKAMETRYQMLLIVYDSMDSGQTPVDWQGNYDKQDAETFMICKEILEAFDIKVNDEICQLIDGTHPDYAPED